VKRPANRPTAAPKPKASKLDWSTLEPLIARYQNTINNKGFTDTIIRFRMEENKQYMGELLDLSSSKNKTGKIAKLFMCKTDQGDPDAPEKQGAGMSMIDFSINVDWLRRYGKATPLQYMRMAVARELHGLPIKFINDATGEVIEELSSPAFEFTNIGGNEVLVTGDFDFIRFGKGTAEKGTAFFDFYTMDGTYDKPKFRRREGDAKKGIDSGYGSFFGANGFTSLEMLKGHFLTAWKRNVPAEFGEPIVTLIE